jgi:DNA mismatch endonuclease, patch repair protein
MTDVVSKAKRSRMMAGIRGSNTKPERVLRTIVHRAGFRFRLHRSDLPGRPDLVFPKYRAAVLVNGCFWHRHRNCKYSYSPKSRAAFWRQKFRENVARDQRQTAALRKLGWRVKVVWECDLRTDKKASLTANTLTRWLRQRSKARTHQ